MYARSICSQISVEENAPFQILACASLNLCFCVCTRVAYLRCPSVYASASRCWCILHSSHVEWVSMRLKEERERRNPGFRVLAGREVVLSNFFPSLSGCMLFPVQVPRLFRDFLPARAPIFLYAGRLISRLSSTTPWKPSRLRKRWRVLFLVGCFLRFPPFFSFSLPSRL